MCVYNMEERAIHIQAIKMAILERLEEGLTFEQLEEKNSISKITLSRYYDRCAANPLDSQPLSDNDIKLILNDKNRAPTLSAK